MVIEVPPIFEKPKRRKKTVISPVMTILLLTPVVLFVFVSGIYIGMSLVSQQTFQSDNNQNLAKSTDLEGHGNLRGMGTTTEKPVQKLQDSEDAIDAPLIREDRNFALAPAATLSALSDRIKNTASLSDSFLEEKEFENEVKESLHVDSIAHFSGGSSMDSPQIVLGAWIRLDAISLDNDMRTVFSNKGAGCETDSLRNGISMYVNEWQNANQVLYLEYGTLKSGCEKVSSGTIKILPNRWYHVAAAFLREAVTLYIDGVEVGRKEQSFHEVQRTNPMRIGHYDQQGQFPLYGNVSHFAIAHGETNDVIDAPTIVRSMMNIRMIEKTPNLWSLFKFKEASTENSDIPAQDSMGHQKGTYTFSSRGRQVSGIKYKLIDGTSGRPPTAEEITRSDELGRTRRQSVKEGMKGSWSGYKTYAWGRDELKPSSKRGTDNWGGMGVTLVDSLDTLWLMDMKAEFNEAVEWIRSSLSFDRAGTVSTFETTIRELGGLLSAYDLSGETVLLNKADDLGTRLAQSFNTRSGIPTGQVNLQLGSGGARGEGSAVLAELGTLQVEFRYLAHATKKKEFESKAMKAFQVMYSKHPNFGLYPIKVSLGDGSFTDRHVTFGALGDSFYEYLLKLWIQGGKKETWLREMYDNSINGVVEKLLQVTRQSGLAYLSDWDGRTNYHKMDHLVCFMPGILALGSVTDPNGKESPRAVRDMALAKALMYTCREMYHRTATGISPEFVDFGGGNEMNTATSAPFYILRPETAESLFVLNQLTKDPIYREWAWEIWTAIDNHCRIGVAYGALQNVNNAQSGVDDRMESFFLAETLKYLYLAQDPDHEIDLMKYVFNTEAHPTRVLPDSHVPVPPI